MELPKGRKAAWLENSPTLESFKRNLKRFSSGNGSRVIHVICLFGMFTILDYSRALEYSIIRCYTNIVYY